MELARCKDAEGGIDADGGARAIAPSIAQLAANYGRADNETHAIALPIYKARHHSRS